MLNPAQMDDGILNHTQIQNGILNPTFIDDRITLKSTLHQDNFFIKFMKLNILWFLFFQ